MNQFSNQPAQETPRIAASNLTPTSAPTWTARLRNLCLHLLLLLSACVSHAATYTWTGAGWDGDTDYKWSNPMNWQGLAAPQPGEQDVQLVFPNSGAPRSTTNDVLNLVIQSVVFQGANYSVHGPVANGITMTLRGPFAGGAFAVLTTANGCQFGSSTRLQLASTGTVAVASGTMLTVKSRVSGIYGFTKTGPGTLSFQGLQANTFTGPVTVQNGVLDFRGVGTALPGALIIGDGNLAYSPIARLYLDEQISDTSPVTVNANGTLELDGHDDLIGSLALAGGATVTTIEGVTTGTLTLNGNVTNHVGAAGVASTVIGKLSLGSTPRGFFVDADSELVVAANISGATAGLVKAGPGQLTLTGAGNTYFGSTTVQAGTLALVGEAKPGSLDNGTVVAQGARLVLQNAVVGNEALSLNGTTNAPALAFAGTNSWAGEVMVAGDCAVDVFWAGYSFDHLTFSGVISGAGAMRLVGWGDLHFTGFGGNTFSGGYHGENGRTHFEKSASASALGGPLFVGRAEDPFPHAHVIVETLNQIPNNVPVTIRNSGGLTANANDTLGTVVIEGGLVHSASGSFTFSGNVTNRIGTNDLSGIYGDTFLTAGEHVFHNEWLSILNVYGALHGAGGVTMQGGGMMIFFNTNSYAGLTHVADGDLRLDENGRPGSSAAGTVVDGLSTLQLFGVGVTNETLQLEPKGNHAPILSVFYTNFWKGPVVLNANADIRTDYDSHLEFDGPVSGPGGILFRGDQWGNPDGALVLSGNTDNSYLGDTTVLEGTLVLNKISAAAIPGNLVIGHPTNGAPAASVVCQRPTQFASVTLNTLNDRHVTAHPSGGLHCGGHEQFIANLHTTGGSIFTEGGTLNLHGGWLVHPDNSYSYFSGKLRLASPYADHTHHFSVETNASLFFVGDISQGISTASLSKQGKGNFVLWSSNSFDGQFTIDEGRVIATGAQPFGTANGGTQVGYDGTLFIYSLTNAEPLTLAGSGYTNQGALVVLGQSQFNGPITLGYNTDIVTPADTNLLVFNGLISGPGGLTKLGEGKLVLAGNADNTYTGATKAKQGALELTKTNATAIRGALEIAVGGGDGIVRYLRSAQLSDLTPVNIGTNGQLRVLGHSDTIGSLAGFGVVELLGGSLITGNDNTATTYGGEITGIGGTLTKAGTNTFTLTGNNGYTGTTFAKGGTLIVNGQQPQSPVTIQTGGALAGTGTVGAISDLSGYVTPGNSCGTLKCAGFITHSPANQLQIEINGTTPGVSCDQLDVSGAVSLMGGTLQLAMNFPGAVSNQYVIVKNDGVDLVTGSFTGLPQNASITNHGVAFQIVYNGGDGNDIVLIQKSLANNGPQVSGIQKLEDGTMKIGGQGQPNASYDVEATESLTTPIAWTVIGSVTANAAGDFSFTDPGAAQHPVRFYRFVQQ